MKTGNPEPLQIAHALHIALFCSFCLCGVSLHGWLQPLWMVDKLIIFSPSEMYQFCPQDLLNYHTIVSHGTDYNHASHKQ
jgi:hypothetical protein